MNDFDRALAIGLAAMLAACESPAVSNDASSGIDAPSALDANGIDAPGMDAIVGDGGCTPEAHGSCTMGTECLLFIGPYWTTNDPRDSCPGGTYIECGCPLEGSVGFCHDFEGLLNEQDTYYYAGDAAALMASCSGTWTMGPGAPDAGPMPDAGRPVSAACMPASAVIAVAHTTCDSGQFVTSMSGVGQTFRVPEEGWLSGIEIIAAAPPGVGSSSLSLAVYEDSPSGPIPLGTAPGIARSTSPAMCPLSPTVRQAAYFDLQSAGGPGAPDCLHVYPGRDYWFQLAGGLPCVSSMCSGTPTFCSSPVDCGWNVRSSGTDTYADGFSFTPSPFGPPMDSGAGDLVFQLFVAR